MATLRYEHYIKWLEEELSKTRSQRDQLLEALEECVTELEHVKIFVTTKEKIKQPEGIDLFNQTINLARKAIAAVKGERDKREDYNNHFE
jgi:predicted  nucleic acid-binding Zn-ribbon protein